MLVLITYDVNTQTVAGRTRLRKVAKECTNYGQRVQNSVFECQMDAAKCRQVKDILEKIIDKETDSLRFYYLGEKYKNKVEHVGAKAVFDVMDESDYRQLKDMGVKFQINLPSIAGMYGNRIKKKAMLLLKEKAITHIGTDIHNYNIFQKFICTSITKNIQNCLIDSQTVIV